MKLIWILPYSWRCKVGFWLQQISFKICEPETKALYDDMRANPDKYS